MEHPGVAPDTYHTLGPKTLWVFVLNRIHATSVLFLAAVALFAVKDQPFLKEIASVPAAARYAQIAAWGALGLCALVFALTFLVAWVLYITYKFALSADALKIKKGILTKTETAIPYRQIQNVDIHRDLTFQAMGLSRIVILTAGQEDDKDAQGGESEGVLPALDKNLAEWLQAELLRRANVQKVANHTI